MTTTATDNILLASASVTVEARDGAAKPAIVSILAYSGGIMTVGSWGPIAIDLAGLDLPKGQVGILADHDASLRGVVGHGTAAIRDQQLVVAGSIAPVTDVARQVIELAKGGFDLQASVGVEPIEHVRVREQNIGRARVRPAEPSTETIRSQPLRRPRPPIPARTKMGSTPGPGTVEK